MSNKIWKRNAVVATVLLFVCAGIYLNWSYNRDTQVADLSETWDESALAVSAADNEAALAVGGPLDGELAEAVTASMEELETLSSPENYFAQIRLSRQQSRDSTIELLQETIAYETGADDTQATMASQQLQSVVNLALDEAQIESLVIAKGYTDCVCFMNDDTVSVAVPAPETGLTSAEVATIADIVLSQSDYTMADIRVIEVN